MNITLTVTNARINQGYQGYPAITFNEKGTFAHFQVSVPKFDLNAENKTKWLNLQIRAIGKKIVERIQKCNLTEGQYINLLLEMDSNEFTRQDGKTARELCFNIIDFDIPRATKSAQTQQVPVQNGYAIPQGQYAQGVQQPMPAQTAPVQKAAQTVGTFTVLPDTPVQQPVQQTNAFVAPVNGGFTGFEAAGQAMGIPDDGSAFMDGFGVG